jgi:hypothetical protein
MLSPERPIALLFLLAVTVDPFPSCRRAWHRLTGLIRGACHVPRA